MYKTLLYDGREHVKLAYAFLCADFEYAERVSDRLLFIDDESSKKRISKFITETKHLGHTLEVVSNDAAFIAEVSKECALTGVQMNVINTKEFIGFDTIYTDAQIRKLMENERKILKLSEYEYSLRRHIKHGTYHAIVTSRKRMNGLQARTLCQVAQICNVHPAQLEGSRLRHKLLAYYSELEGVNANGEKS